ncbi:spore gernimation protein GerPD [Caldifermentibacillus hisashii]|uniref:spore gernimation protein GerPD n=1 Tax=Bacillaceae TaxID=186817 RepID=UPI0020407DFB|nr:spore gernimation protein GerPD [Caldibacillus thermoamylovorans]MCM3797392.1 spore gernimation protein GerPD [Caldibacillus thermoamylovorans]
MILEVINHDLHVGNVNIIEVASSSAVLVGDTNSMQMVCAYDSPSSSLLIGPFVPLSQPR